MTKMKRLSLISATALLLLLFTTSSAFAEWIEWKSDKFGFKMQIPKATKMVAKDFQNDWGGFEGTILPVKIYGIAKLNTFPTVEEMEAFGVKITKIPGKHWNLVEEGKNVNGWTWFRTYKAELKRRVVYGILAHSKKGAFIILLTTTKKNLQENEADYMKWYESLTAY